MIELHIAREKQSGADLRPYPGPGTGACSPEFSISRVGRYEAFFSNVRAILGGPAAPKKFLGDPYFRDCWIDQRSPRAAFAVAVACQVLVILFPPPVWNIRSVQVEAFSPPMELTWYGPAKDFPAILPPLPAPKAAPKNEPSKTPPSRGSDALHPWQTIISGPLHPTHPRQTLIQPGAPPEPPRILPQLPNIVRLAVSEPARPKVQLTSQQLAAMRPKAVRVETQDSAVPEISTPEKSAGEINIASSAQAPPKPALPVNPMSAPRTAPRREDKNASAPEFTQQSSGDATTLIALSAAPAPVAPPASIPPGNLSARISISPEGSQPGAPAGATPGNGTNASPSTGAGGHGPEGIFISGGNNALTAPVSGLGIGSASRGAGNALPARPVPRASIPPRDSNSPRLNSGSAQGSPKLDIPPEKVLGSKRVYTLHVNMPNLTSASGSWVLNFAELDEMDALPRAGLSASDVVGPVPLRKVDPKYPPELRTAHVEGEVIVYAIVRKDGTVDSIQLVHSVDAQLDANAMEALAQWKFQPAEKRGEPIDLEAVVHIPFRSRAPAF